MTNPPEAIEAVARAILKARFYDCEPEMYKDLNDFYAVVWDGWEYEVRHEAQAAMDTIIPMLTAPEREHEAALDRKNRPICLWCQRDLTNVAAIRAGKTEGRG